MSQRTAHSWINIGSTVNTGTANLSDANSTDEIPSNSCARYVVECTGRDTTANVPVGFTITAMVKNVSGTRALAGSATQSTAQGDATLTGATGTLIVSGGIVVVQVTGVNTKTISWTVHAKLIVD